MSWLGVHGRDVDRSYSSWLGARGTVICLCVEVNSALVSVVVIRSHGAGPALSPEDVL